MRERYGKFAGIVGIATNILLFCIKIFAGIVFHSVADCGGCGQQPVGFRILRGDFGRIQAFGETGDKEHPYGHARIEYISGLIVSLVILLLGFQLAQSSLGKILHPEESETSLVAVGILVVSVLIKLWQFLFYRTVGRRISSTTLEATAADSRNDVFSTVAILIGMGITWLTSYNLDGWMA